MAGQRDEIPITVNYETLTAGHLEASYTKAIADGGALAWELFEELCYDIAYSSQDEEDVFDIDGVVQLEKSPVDTVTSLFYDAYLAVQNGDETAVESFLDVCFLTTFGVATPPVFDQEDEASFVQ